MTYDPNGSLSTVTIPAMGYEETVTLHAPWTWHERIQRLADKTVYGPDFTGPVLENLRRMSHSVSLRETEHGLRWLMAAERAARVEHLPPAKRGRR